MPILVVNDSVGWGGLASQAGAERQRQIYEQERLRRAQFEQQQREAEARRAMDERRFAAEQGQNAFRNAMDRDRFGLEQQKALNRDANRDARLDLDWTKAEAQDSRWWQGQADKFELQAHRLNAQGARAEAQREFAKAQQARAQAHAREQQERSQTFQHNESILTREGQAERGDAAQDRIDRRLSIALGVKMTETEFRSKRSVLDAKARRLATAIRDLQAQHVATGVPSRKREIERQIGELRNQFNDVDELRRDLADAFRIQLEAQRGAVEGLGGGGSADSGGANPAASDLTEDQLRDIGDGGGLVDPAAVSALSGQPATTQPAMQSATQPEGKPIDAKTAAMYLARAAGNKELARQMAARDGWRF